MKLTDVGFQHCLFLQEGSFDFDVVADVDLRTGYADLKSVLLTATLEDARSTLTSDMRRRLERAAVDVGTNLWSEQ